MILPETVNKHRPLLETNAPIRKSQFSKKFLHISLLTLNASFLHPNIQILLTRCLLLVSCVLFRGFVQNNYQFLNAIRFI